MFALDHHSAFESASADLRAADRLIARAVAVLCRAPSSDEFGMPAASRVSLDAGWLGSDARAAMRAAEVLRHMPITLGRFIAGELSWSVVRALCAEVDPLPVEGRAALDAEIGTAKLCEPEDVLELARARVSVHRQDLVRAREDRAIEKRFLQVQGRLDGSGSLYGEADAESLATIVAALDAAAERPVSAADPETPSRAQQRMDALIALAEASLQGDAGRSRARVYATVDASRPEEARLLWGLPGSPPRLSRVATETMLCDAEVVPIVFDGAQPVEVGTTSKSIPDKVRTTVLIRDGGCRFPGCGAPMSWCDVHHIRPRSEGGGHDPTNLVSLCRRCHRRAHRFRWRITTKLNGTIEFTRRGKTYASRPRAR